MKLSAVYSKRYPLEKIKLKPRGILEILNYMDSDIVKEAEAIRCTNNWDRRNDKKLFRNRIDLLH